MAVEWRTLHGVTSNEFLVTGHRGSEQGVRHLTPANAVYKSRCNSPPAHGDACSEQFFPKSFYLVLFLFYCISQARPDSARLRH
jgi:hypothetical protein